MTLCIESLGSVLPTRTSGRIVGIAACRGAFGGDHVIVACEFGLYRLWDDGLGEMHADKVESPEGAQ